jgi:hypothetical protein
MVDNSSGSDGEESRESKRVVEQPRGKHVGYDWLKLNRVPLSGSASSMIIYRTCHFDHAPVRLLDVLDIDAPRIHLRWFRVGLLDLREELSDSR